MSEIPAPRHVQHVPKAALYGILTSLALALISVFVKIVGERASIDTILFVRYWISFIIILPWALKKPRELLVIGAPGKLILRSAMSLLAIFTFFLSLKSIPVGDALVLNNTYPLFIPIIALVFHKIRTPHKMWYGIAIGFLGVIAALQPNPQSFTIGSLFALASGIFFAFAYVMIRFMTKAFSTVQILFYNFLICGLLTIPFLPIGWVHFNWEVGLLLVLIALLSVSYQFFSTIALSKAPARITSTFMYLSILFGVIADYLLWDIVPNTWSFVGIFLIILGGIVTIYFGQKEMKA